MIKLIILNWFLTPLILLPHCTPSLLTYFLLSWCFPYLLARIVDKISMGFLNFIICIAPQIDKHAFYNPVRKFDRVVHKLKLPTNINYLSILSFLFTFRDQHNVYTC